MRNIWIRRASATEPETIMALKTVTNRPTAEVNDPIQQTCLKLVKLDMITPRRNMAKRTLCGSRTYEILNLYEKTVRPH